MGVEKVGSKSVSHRSPFGLKPAAAIQNVLHQERLERSRRCDGRTHRGGCGAFPSTKNAGKDSGFSNCGEAGQYLQRAAPVKGNILVRP